jgi:hypothetical protein
MIVVFFMQLQFKKNIFLLINCLVLFITSVALSSEPRQCTDLFGFSYSEKGRMMQIIIESSGRKSSDHERESDTHFIVDRGREKYEYGFGYFFKAHFESLNKDDVIFNAGSGDEHLADSLVSPNSPKYVGVTYARIERPESYFKNFLKSKFKFFVGRFFESISNTEFLKFGKFKIITDYFGIMSYSERPDLVLQRYLQMLDPDGSIYILQGNRFYLNNQPDFMGWLENINGIDVTVLQTPEGYSYMIRKTGDPIEIPRLRLDKTRPGSPPRRFYRMTGTYLP